MATNTATVDPTASAVADAPVVAPAATAPAQPQQPVLDVQDLQNLLNIVDFSAQQGVFKGWDTIIQIFTLRNKLANFLQSISPPAAPGAPKASVDAKPAKKSKKHK